jgi:hypothetical protein
MRYTILILFCLALGACKPEPDTTPVDLGYNYFPTQVGATWIYKVDSLAYDDNTGSTTIDTFTYQYKEQITGTFTDVSGKPAQLVSRFYRERDTMPWIRATNSTLLVTELNAQRVNENIRFVKLVFPLEAQKTWNGNSYNLLGEEEYTVTQFDAPKTVGGIAYGQTLTVLQKDELNFIEEIKREEVYARNTGLVYLLSDSINTQVNGSRGFRYRLTLKTFTP